MAKCKTCGAPVNLAPDGDPRYETPRTANPMISGVELIGRIYYMEGRSEAWRAAKMNAVAQDLMSGKSIAWARRLFPRSAEVEQ